MKETQKSNWLKSLQVSNVREGEPMTHQGSPKKLRSGEWGAWVNKTEEELKFEDLIEVTTRAGKKFTKICMEIIFECEDGYIVRTV